MFINRTHTEETKKKISKANKGKKRSEEAKRKYSQSKIGCIPWNKGLPRTEEVKEKIRLKLLGRKIGTFSDEHKKNMSNAGKGHVVSEEAKSRMNFSKRKDKHPNWQGGLSFESYEIDFDKQLKNRIKERDNYNCVLCGETRRLHVHHINYLKKDNRIENLITLCRTCHMKTNGNRKQWLDYFVNNYIFLKELLESYQ